MKTEQSQWSDREVVEWLVQYSGRQAGYYPGLRRTRVAAEREAMRRGLEWRSLQTPWITAARRTISVGGLPTYTSTLNTIRATDTTRPDGAIARRIEV